MSPKGRKRSYFINYLLEDEYLDLLKDLGKHKKSVGCLYTNKLADIDQNVLEKLVKQSYLDMKIKNS